ncbi:MAG: GntR family transcriptional regulator, partial [Chloroflexi bacterium]|nr:GntR family transcriptional regulator [Chloroflexota bacterium]
LFSVPRRGTIVVSLSAADVEEVYTLRADLESRAFRRATDRLSDADLADLERLLDVMRAASRAENLTALLDADIAFHRKIVKAAGWPQLHRIWESLHPRTLMLYTIETLVKWSPEMHAERHRPVLDALRAHDIDTAAAAIRRHILEVGSEIIRLGQGTGESSGITQAVLAWGPD